jgi:hypothetical protein
LKGRAVSKISGSYLGFVEFDGRRYWDARDNEAFKLCKPETILPSDSRYRPDLNTLLAGNVEQAQLRKEELEELQRRDVKLRAEYEKMMKK